MHPGSPPGWESQRPHGVQATTFVVHPAARRGGSLNAAGGSVGREPCSVHPGSPPGWGVSTGEGPMCGHGCASCTPAARRGGSLNFACVAADVGQWLVHPGSPPGWESQRRHRRPHHRHHHRAPGSPPGGSLNHHRANYERDTARVHSRQPAGVGVQHDPPRELELRVPLHPAARRGGSLNQFRRSRDRVLAPCTRQPAGWEFK